MKMTFKVILIGGLIVFFAVVIVAVFAPVLIWKPPQTTVAIPYSDNREKGREIFYSNGCNYCHTQYVREEDTAMGAVSLGGNYIFDNPLTLGSERTGPDLSYVGAKRSHSWEVDHLKNPRKYSPLSIMPSFDFLPDDELNLVADYLFGLGDRVALERMISPPDAYTNLTNPIADTIIQPNSNANGWDLWNATQLQAGKELYTDKCLTCHGCSGNGLGSYGGTLAVTPADFKQEPFKSMPDNEFFWHISEGIPGTVMPTWKVSLTENERWQVVQYVQTIFAKPNMHDPSEGDPSGSYAGLTNPVPLNDQNLQDGKETFIRECMVCHGDAGRGHGPYRDLIQPGPPDFGDGSYGDYTDADYFWRISEGVPWSAMPAWKMEYGEEDRWKLVHYIRTIFTQTEDPLEPKDAAPPHPAIYDEQTMPESASFERGRKAFLENCVHCHGLTGDGQGWDGQYLNPTPANFQGMAGKEMTPQAQGEHLVKVSFGIQNTAMPSWDQWMPQDERWDAIKYLMAVFMAGKPKTESVYNNGEIANNYALLSSDVYKSEGHSIDPAHGGELYTQYCAVCHAEDGQGNGPGIKDNASKGPAAFPKDMGEAYIYWRIMEGVPDSMMYAFQGTLTDNEVWDITLNLISKLGGGK